MTVPALSALGALGQAAAPACVAGPQSGSPSGAYGEAFVERAVELGLVHETLSGFDEMSAPGRIVTDWSQSGAAFGDADGDGDQDLAACGSMLRNRLFMNPGAPDTAWVERGSEAGIRSGQVDRAPAFGDYDRDGDLDLFIGSMFGSGLGSAPGRGRLYRNDGSATFTDVTALSGTVGRGRTLFANWFDLDNDGRLDLYLSEFHSTPNAWYRNNGGGSFSELAALVGLADIGSTHATGVADLDGDDEWDVIVGNDHWVGDIVGIPGPNKGDAFLKGDADGSFSDLTVGSGTDQFQGIMGISFGDYDADGDFDIYKTDVGGNWLLRNEGWPGSGQAYTSLAAPLGVLDDRVPFPDGSGMTGLTSGWAAMFMDVDLDSVLDLYVVNGHVAGINKIKSFLPRQQINTFYRGLGASAGYAFEEIGAELGLHGAHDDRAGAYADVDEDGDLDLVVLETAGALRYYENRVERGDNGYLVVKVEGRTSGPEGEGTLVRWVDPSGGHHSGLIGTEGPTASQHERLAHFGLGDLDDVDLSVRFASGIELDLPGVAANTRLELIEPELVSVSHDSLPAGAHAALGDPTEFEVTVFAHSADGTALGAGAAVAIDVPGLTPVAAVEDLGGGSYRRLFQTDGAPGAYRVELDFAGFAPRIRPVVHLTGAPDPAQTRVWTSAESLRAGSSDTVRLLVVPSDAGGVALGAGRTVTIDLPGKVAGQTLTDLGDGTYEVVVDAPPTPADPSIAVYVDGIAMNPFVLPAAGLADPARTIAFPVAGYSHHSASPDVTRLYVVPRDAASRRLGPGAEVELLLHLPELPPEPPTTVSGAPTPRLRASGQGSVGGASGSTPGSAPPNGGTGGPALPQPEPMDGAELIEVDALPRPDGSFLFALRVEPELDAIANSIDVDVYVDGELVRSIQLPFRL